MAFDLAMAGRAAKSNPAAAKAEKRGNKFLSLDGILRMGKELPSARPSSEGRIFSERNLFSRFPLARFSLLGMNFTLSHDGDRVAGPDLASIIKLLIASKPAFVGSRGFRLIFVAVIRVAAGLWGAGQELVIAPLPPVPAAICSS